MKATPIMGPRTQAARLGSTAFDGARGFDGTRPDLDRHWARVNQSAINLKLKPVVDLDTLISLLMLRPTRGCRYRSDFDGHGQSDARCLSRVRFHDSAAPDHSGKFPVGRNA
jgi:hypothetical protein